MTKSIKKEQQMFRYFYKSPTRVSSKNPITWPLSPGPLVIARVSQVTLGVSKCDYLCLTVPLLPAGLGYLSASSIWGVFIGAMGPC